MEKKYKLINSNIWNGKKIYRIEALRSFGNVKKGDFGGWVEGEHNLSHEGNCWIPHISVICGSTRIEGDFVVQSNIDVLYTVSNPEKLKRYYFPRMSWRINYSGFDEKTNQHIVKVGCQFHSIDNWKNPAFRNNFVNRYYLNISEVSHLLGILAEIEKYHCQTDPFKKIEENIQALKKEVTEPLKTETISLISSLQVSKTTSNRDPKTGRFMKKGS